MNIMVTNNTRSKCRPNTSAVNNTQDEYSSYIANDMGGRPSDQGEDLESSLDEGPLQPAEAYEQEEEESKLVRTRRLKRPVRMESPDSDSDDGFNSDGDADHNAADLNNDGAGRKHVTPSPTTMISIENEDVFEVEAIVGYRLNNDRAEYLIKWVGYPDEENTWEPESNLDENTLDIANAYKHEEAKRVGKRRLKKPMRVESSDTDSDDGFNSDGVSDGNHITPSPQKPNQQMGKEDQELSCEDDEDDEIIVKRKMTPRKIIFEDSDDSDTSDDDNGNHHKAKRQRVPPNLSSSPTKLNSASNSDVDDMNDADDTSDGTPSSPQKQQEHVGGMTDKEMSCEDEDDEDSDVIVKRRKTRRNNNTFESDDDSDYCDVATVPPSQSNLSSSPTKLKMTSMHCPSKIDAHTKERLPFPSRSPHVCYTDPEGNRHCYALDTLYRVAIENYKEGNTLMFLQPPHFDSPMSDDLKDHIACRFGRKALIIENSKNYRKYYERFVLGLGTRDLYCCPICYNEANRRLGRHCADNSDDSSESSDNEYEGDCFTFEDDPLTILEDVGFNAASKFCFLEVRGVKKHMQNEHNVFDLGELKGNDLFKRFKIKSQDGLLQHFVLSNDHYKDDMWGYWRDRDDENERNIDKFRNLVQLVGENEEEPTANQSDFCSSFPNRAKQIWEKVSGPYLKDDVSDEEENEKFINDDENDTDEDENEVRENPYFHPTDESEEEEIDEYLEDLQQRVEQSREENENDSSSSDESNSYKERSDSEEGEDDSERNTSGDEDGDEEQSSSDDSWVEGKKNKLQQRRAAKADNDAEEDQDSEDEGLFESDYEQARTRSVIFTASDDEE